MENEATQSGASEDVHSRLVNFLGGDEPTEKTEKPKAQPAKQTKPEPKPQPKQEEEHRDLQADDSEEEPEEAEEEVSEAEPYSDSEESEETETEENPKPKTLKEVAESLGMDYAEFLDSIAAETKIDGEEGSAPLAKLLKSYQLEGHLNRKLMEQAEAKKQWDDQVKQFRQAFEGDLQNLKQSFSLAQNMLYNEFQSINWQELEANNPTEYVRLRQKFSDRQTELNQAFQFINQKEQVKQAEETQKFKAFLTEEAKKLDNSIPEWKDAETKKKDQAALRDYLKSHSYSDQEIDQVYDHRWVLILRDAARYRDLQNKKPLVKKKVAEAPKLQKPGAKKSHDDIERASFQEQRKHLKKTGKVPKGLLERFV